VTLLQTTSATPFFFNFHHGDLGNFTVIGPSGSGKTVVMNFLAAQAQKFSPRTILFDKDRGAEVFVRGIGGRTAASPPATRPGSTRWPCPTVRSTAPSCATGWACCSAANGPEELATIAAAVDAAYANDPALRRLSHFRELLAGSRRPQPGDLASRLDAWIGAASTAGCSTMPRTGLTFRPARSAST
jgi:type IV secretion system protein VirB4